MPRVMADRRESTRIESSGQGPSAHAVDLEPAKHALPSVLGGVGAIARAIVREEGVAGLGIDLDLRFLGGLGAGGEGSLHLIHVRRQDGLVLAPIQPEDRSMKLAR